MKYISVAFLVLVAACSSSTAPSKAGDPSLLFTNTTGSWVYVTWQDGAAIFGKDSIPPRTDSQCVRFLAQPDSAFWHIEINDPIGGSAAQTAPYFNPADRPAWRVIVSSSSSGTSILTTLTDIPC